MGLQDQVTLLMPYCLSVVWLNTNALLDANNTTKLSIHIIKVNLRGCIQQHNNKLVGNSWHLLMKQFAELYPHQAFQTAVWYYSFICTYLFFIILRCLNLCFVPIMYLTNVCLTFYHVYFLCLRLMQMCSDHQFCLSLVFSSFLILFLWHYAFQFCCSNNNFSSILTFLDTSTFTVTGVLYFFKISFHCSNSVNRNNDVQYSLYSYAYSYLQLCVI